MTIFPPTILMPLRGAARRWPDRAMGEVVGAIHGKSPLRLKMFENFY